MEAATPTRITKHSTPILEYYYSTVGRVLQEYVLDAILKIIKMIVEKYASEDFRPPAGRQAKV